MHPVTVQLYSGYAAELMSLAETIAAPNAAPNAAASLLRIKAA
jgi:hypothetical protein